MNTARGRGQCVPVVGARRGRLLVVSVSVSCRAHNDVTVLERRIGRRELPTWNRSSRRTSLLFCVSEHPPPTSASVKSVRVSGICPGGHMSEGFEQTSGLRCFARRPPEGRASQSAGNDVCLARVALASVLFMNGRRWLARSVRPSWPPCHRAAVCMSGVGRAPCGNDSSPQRQKQPAAV